ncbi:MAG: hypothetical protein D3923_00845 [Candidatus Electrothrix sp. AR3]|nr:hypothetical protein [Candidatus Electrothrix sp. AR3]
MDFDKFLDIIWKQKNTGDDGFEGMVAKLLEQLTGQRFYLSRSGNQGGRDMASNFLMAECKNYKESTGLKSGDLLVKFADASLASLKPDLWMVVTTKRLSDQDHHEQLRQFSIECGIAYFSIDPQGEEHSFLAALCAYAPEITLRHLEESCEKFKEKSCEKLKKNEKYFSNSSEAAEFAHTLKNEFASYLQALKANPEVAAKAEKLKHELSVQNIGYDHWREEQNAWLSKQLQDKDKSRAAFAQNLAVRAEGQFFIHRKVAQKALDNWFANWPEQHNFFVMLGEEGDGKTWAVADWLFGKLSASFPVIFLPSRRADCKEPESLLSEVITKQLKKYGEEYWQRRLQRWLKRPAGSTPLLLLVMDGLNEGSDVNWRHLLEKFSVEPWFSRVAVLMTCRNNFWQEKMTAVDSVTRFELLPYDDTELNQALAESNLPLTEFHKNIIDILRVPRYFDLAVRLRKNIGSKGEITRERLIYEDWRDRIGRKSDNSSDNSLMNDKEFLDMIRDLSRSAMKPGNLSRRDVADELSPYEEHYRVRKQLESEGIIKWDDGSCGINKKHLTLGLGLLLAKEAVDAEKYGKNIVETITCFQEPQPDMDLKVSICAMALCHAVYTNLSQEVCLGLCKVWVSGRNIDKEDWQRITAYLPVRPEVYLRLMEQIWLSDTNRLYLRDTLKARFLQFSAQAGVRQALIPAFERWMGFVHSDGCGRLFNDEKAQEKGRQDVEEALGGNFSGELFDYKLTVTENKELLRLSRFMLAIISSRKRTPYLRAIVTGIIAGTCMGYPDFADDLSWVLRTAKDDIEELLLPEAEKLLKHCEPVAQKAAWWLLNLLGTEKAWQLRDTVPTEYQWMSPSWKLAIEDPCRYYLFNEENYLDCIEKFRDEPDHIVSHLSSVALNPDCGVPDNLLSRFMNTFREISLEKIRSAPDGGSTHEDLQLSKVEPALCAYCPERFAEIINELARQLPERSGMGRRSLSWRIYEYILILDETSRAAVDCAWRISLANTEEEDAELVLFPCVLRGRSLEQQLDFLEERGGKYGYFDNYIPFIQEIDSLSKSALLAAKLIKISSSDQLHNFLSVIASSVVELDDQIMSLLPEFSEIDNSFARCYALQVIFRSKNQKAIQSILNSDWSSASTDNNGECAWGSWLLAEHGQELPFTEISRRVSPKHLGYAIKKRGFKPEEVAAYGEILNRIMPDGYVPTDVLAEVIASCPEYVSQWIDLLEPKMIWHHQEFYESLCEVLLKQQPEQGKWLLSWLCDNSSSRKFNSNTTSFKASDSEAVFGIRQTLLDEAITDNDLFKVAFLAQKYGRHEWLEKSITTLLTSDFALDNAKGLFLLGFMDAPTSGARLDAWIAKKPSWLRDCARGAKKIHERNQWAHHWFEQFVTHEETLQAWAAFRLFLRCVDRRFWLWGEKRINSPEVPYERFEHYRACRKSVEKAIQDNEKNNFKLKDNLVGYKVQKNQLWPWLSNQQ